MHEHHGFITSWICVVTLLITLGIAIAVALFVKKWMNKSKKSSENPDDF